MYRDPLPPPMQPASCMQCSRYVICPPCDASPIMVWCRVWCGAVSVVQGECSAGVVQASVVQNGAGLLPIPYNVAGVWHALPTRSCPMPTMRRSTQVYAAAATGEAEDKTQRRSKDTYDNVSFSLLVPIRN